MDNVNIEEIVIGFLGANKTTGWQVYGDVPKTRPNAFIIVDRTGGPRENIVQDRAEILVEVYHKTSRVSASDEANRVADIIKNLETLEPVMRAKVNSVVKLDDLIGQYWRYQVYCDIWYRRDVLSGDIVYPVIPTTSQVTSVNGKIGAVVLTAADVGADVAGSAAQALTSANEYTDQELAEINTGVTTLTGDGVDNTDPKNPVISLITDDIEDTAANRYTSDTEKARLADTSGVNTGDQDLSGYATTASLAEVATSGDYEDLANKPTIPSIAGLVPDTRTVNGQALNADVTIEKADIGLGNVDNTADVNKPVSTAQQTALDGKANSSHTHPTTDLTATGGSGTSFLRKDNTWATPTNTTYSEITSAEITAGTASTARAISGRRSEEIVTKARVGQVPETRTINGQNLSANRTFTQDDIGDGTTNKQYSQTEKTKLAGIETGAEVNNISDANATDLTDGGTTTLHSHVVTKADVGLGNADNTSDANKPVSTATQTELDKKGVLSYQEFTSSGTWNKPTGAKVVEIFAIGGGGGGGKGTAGAEGTQRNGGGGGGAGGAVIGQFDATALTSSVSVTVGAGGAGATTDGAFYAGGTGGTSSFGTYVSAGGGGGGACGGGFLGAGGGAAGASSLQAGGGGSGTFTGIGFQIPGTNGHIGSGAGGCARSSANAYSGALAGGNSSAGAGGVGGGVSVGTAGSAGTAGSGTNGGAGGGGGGPTAVGGAGGTNGGGGGGGGCAISPATSGNGGAGGAGIVIVITYG